MPSAAPIIRSMLYDRIYRSQRNPARAKEPIDMPSGIDKLLCLILAILWVLGLLKKSWLIKAIKLMT